MSNELQNDSDDLYQEEVNAEVENHQEDGAELATDSDQQHEENAEAVQAVNQEAINKAINKKHFEARQAERERDEALKRLQELERRQVEAQASQIGNIPRMPDPFDDDYEAKVQQRDQAIAEKIRFEHEQSLRQQQQQAAQQQAEMQKQQALQESLTKYTQRATELGISNDELQTAGQTVANYGISDDLTMAILADKDGPLITKHLAANPMAAIELSQMNPFLAGAKLVEIKQKAAALKPRKTEAPKPATNLSGHGTDKDLGKYKLISGAKFE